MKIAVTWDMARSAGTDLPDETEFHLRRRHPSKSPPPERQILQQRLFRSFLHFLLFLLLFTIWLLSFFSADSFSLFVNILFICLLIRCSFNAAVSVDRILQRRRGEWSGSESEWTWRKLSWPGVVWCEVLPWNLPGETEEYHKGLSQDRQSWGPKFETGKYRKRTQAPGFGRDLRPFFLSREDAGT
jgi:hypothetical protein